LSSADESLALNLADLCLQHGDGSDTVMPLPLFPFSQAVDS